MNYEKLDNDQKELVKYWIGKIPLELLNLNGINSFIENHLTPEPVIVTGKWYKNPANKFLVFIDEINTETEMLCGYGFDRDGDWFMKSKTCYLKLVEATREEVEQRMIEEAKRRGYKPGMAIESLFSMSNHKISTHAEYVYTHKDNDIVYGGVWIYKEGKWAYIIDDKAEIKAQIAKARKELHKLESLL